MESPGIAVKHVSGTVARFGWQLMNVTIFLRNLLAMWFFTLIFHLNCGIRWQWISNLLAMWFRFLSLRLNCGIRWQAISEIQLH